LQIDTSTVGLLDENVSIHVVGQAKKSNEIRVFGKIIAPFEIVPGSLLLPRQSDGGPLWDATAICSSNRHQPFSLSAASVPSGLRVEISAEKDTGRRIVRVICNPTDSSAHAKEERHVLQLKAKEGATETELELPVCVLR
jgi:hypothetical protein